MSTMRMYVACGLVEGKRHDLGYIFTVGGLLNLSRDVGYSRYMASYKVEVESVSRH